MVGVDPGPLGQAWPVHPIPEDRQDGGKECHRRPERGDRHEDRAAGQRPEDRRREDHHPEQGEHHGEAAEEDGPVRRGPRGADRVELREALLPLLPVPRHDEQRVVDTHREADHRDHVLDEQVEAEQLSDQGHQAERHGDGEERHDDGDDGGDDRGEDDDQDDQRDADADRLALSEVLLRDLREVDVQRPGASHLHGEAVRLGRGGDVPELLDGRVLEVLERDRDQRVVLVLRDQARCLVRRLLEDVVVRRRRLRQDAPVDLGDTPLELLHERLELRVVDGVRVRVHDEEFGVLGAALAELRVEDVLGLDRLR